MNDITPNVQQTPTSLEAIRQLKLHTYNELIQQKKTVSKSARKLISPLTSTVNKGNSIMHAFNTGIMVFDGMVLGLKLIRKIRRVFR